jgi:hypothetical protein
VEVPVVTAIVSFTFGPVHPQERDWKIGAWTFLFKSKSPVMNDVQ